MPVFTAVHRWLVDSPLWVAFVIAPLFSAFIIYIYGVFGSLVKIEPQQLNLWVIKARIL